MFFPSAPKGLCRLAQERSALPWVGGRRRFYPNGVLFVWLVLIQGSPLRDNPGL